MKYYAYLCTHETIKQGTMIRIAFDIKYRQEIEDGKYKVVTEKGTPVNILRWDMKGRYPILGCTMVSCCDWEGENSWEEERPIAFDKEGCPTGYIPSSTPRRSISNGAPFLCRISSKCHNLLVFLLKNT